MPLRQPPMYATVIQLPSSLMLISCLRYNTHHRLQEGRKRRSAQVSLRPSRLFPRLSGQASVDRRHGRYFRCKYTSRRTRHPESTFVISDPHASDKLTMFKNKNRATVHSAIFDFVDVRHIPYLSFPFLAFLPFPHLPSIQYS